MSGRVFAGRRWSADLRKRTPERRAMDWAGIGPARAGRTGVVTASADQPHGQRNVEDPIVGVAAHIGPWLLIVMGIPMGIRR